LSAPYFLLLSKRQSETKAASDPSIAENSLKNREKPPQFHKFQLKKSEIPDGILIPQGRLRPGNKGAPI